MRACARVRVCACAAGPLVLSMLCTPLLLLCAPLYASAAAIAALPLRRLRAELGDEPHAARARFERADVDGVGGST